MGYFNYQRYLEKNEKNKKNFEALAQQGLPADVPIFTSLSIEKVDFRKLGGDTVQVKSNLEKTAYNNFYVEHVVRAVFDSDYFNISNPSKLKNWSVFW